MTLKIMLLGCSIIYIKEFAMSHNYKSKIDYLLQHET